MSGAVGRTRLLLCLAGLVVPLVLSATGWPEERWKPRTPGGDFASFYYGEQAMARGQDPYSPGDLTALAHEDETRNRVNPFFYPPPFLLFFAWCRPLTMETAYRAWLAANVALFPLALLAIAWWSPRWPTIAALAAIGATFWASVYANLYMGQVNLLVLFVTVAGVAAVERGHERTGGALVGLAAMLKMTPALFVAWWMLRRRWTPVLAACATAVVLSIVSLPAAGLATQLRFYTAILPDFLNGRFHELPLRIALMGNNSIAAMLALVFEPEAKVLPPPAAWLWRVAVLAALGLIAWTVRRNRSAGGPALPLVLMLEAGAVAAAALVLPTYAMELHMPWLVVSFAALATAWSEGFVGRGWAAVLLACWVVCVIPMPWLVSIYPEMGSYQAGLFWVGRTSRFFAEVVTGAACLVASRRCARASVPPNPGTPVPV